ncbi:MAG: phosphoribosylaminoimidazolesuccinocarboxamide synthase [Calditrichaeota bacterium]|nr:MAG: phosphoribosylaminoimidazolesuccinocarboxamide synthase [Calditrichota bacterium]
MERKSKLYEGKAKILYETDDPTVLLQQFKDDATAFNGKKKGTIANKGYVNNQISAHLYRYLASYFIPTHFLDVISDTEMTVTNLQMIPVEVVVRNIAAGSLLKRSDHKEGDVLPAPLLEYFLKDDAKNDPQITREDILEHELCSEEDLETLSRMALKINAVMKSFWQRRNIKLVDFKLEFGKNKDGKVILGDEISPDTCRFWDATTDEKMDKDRFRQDLGQVEETYENMRRRVFMEDVFESE